MNTIINSFLCSTLRWNGVLFVAIFHKSWLFYCLSEGGRSGDAADWASYRSIDSCCGLGFPESGARVGMVNISREMWEWDPRDLAADTQVWSRGSIELWPAQARARHHWALCFYIGFETYENCLLAKKVWAFDVTFKHGRQRKEGHLFTDKLHESAASNNPDLGMDYTKF